MSKPSRCRESMGGVHTWTIVGELPDLVPFVARRRRPPRHRLFVFECRCGQVEVPARGDYYSSMRALLESFGL